MHKIDSYLLCNLRQELTQLKEEVGNAYIDMTLVSGAAKYDGKLDKGNIRYNTTKTWQNAHSEYSRHV